MAQAKQQATLGSLWEEASKRYKADLQRYDEEYESKHSHVWNIHHHKKPTEEIPIMYSAKDFSAELEKKKTDFKDMRMKAHGVFKAMNSLATPVEIIGGQAAAVGSMVSCHALRDDLILITIVQSGCTNGFRGGAVSVQCMCP
jgi:hypothetical protein